ncbi:MAG: hypothetical protein R3Y68_02015 [Rikenellaceae bacterium]
MGLRRRVSAGFLGIVVMLILSGMVSFYELNVLSNETDDILGTNRRYRDITLHLTAALRDQNRAFVQMTAYDDRSYDSLCLLSTERLDEALREARVETMVVDIVDTLGIVASQLQTVTQRLVNLRSVENSPTSAPITASVSAPAIDGVARDTLAVAMGDSLMLALPTPRELYDEYATLYDKMLAEIDRYYTDSQRTLAPGAEQLHNNAYRAVTPVLISLFVMIVIVLMLYYFMTLYCVTPVVNMNKAVKDYLAFKIPFAPKGERHDEMQELVTGIETLIKQGNKPTKE